MKQAWSLLLSFCFTVSMISPVGAAKGTSASSKQGATSKRSQTSTVSSAAKKSSAKSTTSKTPASSQGKRASRKKPAAKSVKAGAAPKTASATNYRRTRKGRVVYNPWREPNFADSTMGDRIDGEDLVVRRSAVEALGPFNGSVVAVDPMTGRILTVVNQKLAFKSGFQPCSTIKIVVGLAALSEGLVERDTPVRLNRRFYLNLTEAIAKSNNPYFAVLGNKLGFEKVTYYARLFGLGERAALSLEEEQPGTLPEEPPKIGGVGMMSSFGEGIQLTPLQLASLLSALANEGTLYYLQYPRNQEEVDNFIPRVKRHLDIQPWIAEIKPGMMGTVEFGTGKRAAYDPEEPIFGKTGTCTDRNSPTHLGWFGSFNGAGRNKLVVVVLLTGGNKVNGPTAAGIAGEIYRRLSSQQYFDRERRLTSPVALVGTQACCLQ